MMKSIPTRFRAYQLGSAGSSFSYFAGGHFTVLEGRLTEISLPQMAAEMTECGVAAADVLHITGWDMDHCAASELEALLELIVPRKIEYPGYPPHCENAEKALAIIKAYEQKRRSTNRPATLVSVTPDYIAGLETAERLALRNIFYHPKQIYPDCGNDNSTVEFFRSGSFNVLSLGDLESSHLSARLRRCRLLCLETDILILAHHGAANGFTTKKFLQSIEPSLAVCSSNYDNHHDHPDEEIRELLYDQDIRLMTTKTGDIIVRSTGTHTGHFEAINYKANTTEISSIKKFRAKKAELLSYNGDTIRQIYEPRRARPYL
jgi:competence protein ComEC